MDGKNVDLDLMEFIERNILPRYSIFDRAHQLPHVTGVIIRSLTLARKVGADLNMAYTVAAYHDLGLQGPRAIHQITSGKILAADARLRKWFSTEQIDVMKKAVEDHRASASHAPRNIYGKIVAEADRDLKPINVFRRAVEYGLDHYPDRSKEQQWERFVEHMEDKYSINGYMRLWIPNSMNDVLLRQIREIINDKEGMRREFDKAYDELKKSETNGY